MTVITADGFKKLAAESVVALKLGTPLNSSITKIAMDNEMNSDQVKRLVETTNQVAYLSQLEDQDDRSFEFPVATYDDIMDNLIGDATIEKSASVGVSTGKPIDLVCRVFQPIEKVAQEKEATIEKWGKNQKLQALKKVASQERNRLDELESAEYDTLVKLAQHRAIVSRDPEALEKMSKFDNQLEMTRLVFGHDKVASDVRRVWDPSQLEDIKKLSDQLGQVKQASEEVKELKPKVEAAEAMIKEAFMAAALRTASKVAKPAVRKIKAAKGVATKIATGAVGAGAVAKAKGIKAFNAFDNVASTNEVRQNTNRKYNAWSSLRG